MSANPDDSLTTDATLLPPRNEIPVNIGDVVSEEDLKTKEQTRQTSGAHNTFSKEHQKPRKQSAGCKNRPANSVCTNINISNASGIQFGSSYTINIDRIPKKQEQYIEETEAIKALFLITEPAEKNHIEFASTHMNDDWRETARALNYSDGQISQIHSDFVHIGLKEVIYQFLLDWIQNEALDATIGRLTKALWRTKQKDVVRRWSIEL